ncbi:unnamed protein product [Schistosoma curassoni]|uniref:DUF1059 domain-containing protein n=1 Tax=Schistosoma curassoni TaxID=6186 RepID=A0A183JFV2_9TREM|nr:unnamed protein product [Schistosoma curassoni]
MKCYDCLEREITHDITVEHKKWTIVHEEHIVPIASVS